MSMSFVYKAVLLRTMQTTSISISQVFNVFMSLIDFIVLFIIYHGDFFIDWVEKSFLAYFFFF